MAEPLKPGWLRKSWAEHYVGWLTVVAVGVAGVYAGVEILDSGGTLLSTVSDQARSSLYISITATSGALLGFGITSATILLTLGSGPRIDHLRGREEWAYTRTVIMGAILPLALATVAFTLLIVLDTDPEPCPVLEVIAVGVSAWAILRVGALVRLIGQLLGLVTKDQRDSADKS